MFDGNFRSRKEVNLSSGGGRRRKGGTTDNKQALLRNAEAQRRQRQEHQRRNQSARTVQRYTRGWLTRLHLLEDLLPTASQSLTATSFLADRLSPWLFKNSTTVREVLVGFAKERPTGNVHVEMSSSTQQDTDAMDLGSSHGAKSTTPRGDTLWFSRKRLIQSALRQLIPDAEMLEDTTSLDALFSLLKINWPQLVNRGDVVVDNQLFLDLTNCLAHWVRSPSSQPSNMASRHDQIAKTLCQWAIQIFPKLQNKNARALLGSVLLCGDRSFLILLPGSLYSSWVVPLAESLETAATAEDVLGQAIWLNLQNGKEQKVLSNLLEQDTNLLARVQEEPYAILQIIYQVLQKGDDLALIASLIVRGDSLEKAAASSVAEIQSTMVGEADDSDDEDYDDGEPSSKEAMGTSAAQSTGTNRISKPSYRLARKDLLTLQKLDKLYQDAIQQLKRGCKTLNQLSASKPSALAKQSMAKTVVRAPWLKWGLRALDGENQKSSLGLLFVESLGFLMQSMTSLRANTKVGPMSALAFNQTFMLYLWQYASQDAATNEDEFSHKAVAMSIFCDLFAHYLVALSDVDFLKFHTDVNGASGTTGSESGGVVAKDVISSLRNILYDLYWNNPVLVNEVASRNTRGRLLLSATKVWNSLHERWNRLVRHNSFCDESTWWFPHLSSRAGDRAVVPSRERQESQRDSDLMEVDDEDSDSDFEDQPMSTAEAETDALADAFSDPKMARVLTCIPQALPFDRRVKLFSSLLKADKQKTMQAASNRSALMAMSGDDAAEMFIDGIARERVTIRRAKLYNDSMQQLNELGPKLKHKVQVSFVNQHGANEAGIDGGGVFKEFLDDLIKDGFASRNEEERGAAGMGAPPLFSVTPLQTLAVNFGISDNEQMLEHYEFLGRVLGKAVYESILVEPQFCLPFLNQLLGKTNSMEDLKNYDDEYYNNLNKLKLLSDNEVEALGLTFEVTLGGSGAGRGTAIRTVELIQGGGTIPVKSKAHIFQYMHAVANQLLNIQGARQTKAFLRGFRDLIPASWVRLFSANELQNLISGDDSVRGIDVASLKRSINYLGGYHQSQPYIQDFWDIIENDLTPEQQRKFLRFMTSCSRQPLLGFGSLDPSPSIQQIRLTENELSKNSKLPTSQTCFNLLKLPNYQEKMLLKEKLLAAIESGAGFELT